MLTAALITLLTESATLGTTFVLSGGTPVVVWLVALVIGGPLMVRQVVGHCGRILTGDEP